jgi:Ni,Fe-hydrogenase I cytochrome b subunit
VQFETRARSLQLLAGVVMTALGLISNVFNFFTQCKSRVQSALAIHKLVNAKNHPHGVTQEMKGYWLYTQTVFINEQTIPEITLYMNKLIGRAHAVNSKSILATYTSQLQSILSG